MWRKVWRFILRLGTVGAAVGLVADFFNLLQHLKLFEVEPPGSPIVFEDYPPNPLPECLFTETFRAEAEPDFYLNWFDWAIGNGPAEESAYRRAEDRIWKTVAPGVPSSGEADLDSGERLAAQGLRLIQRKFYFDRHGYHALVVMGRLMDLQKSVESGCEIDRERGRLEQRETSRRFTCESLHRVINTEVNGIMRVYNPDQCWVSYSYEINPQNRQIRFQQEYFIRNPEEEVSDEKQWGM